MINLVPIDFLLGLPLIINRNDGKNKFKVHISKNVAKMGIFWHKIGQNATFAPTFNGNWAYNLGRFYPIFMFDYTKMTSLTRQIECR